MADFGITEGIAVAGLLSSAAGAATSAYGAAQQGAGQQQMYQYQAGVARVNEQIARENADYARDTGEVQAVEEGMKERAQESATKAAFGASGFDVNTGSHADVLDSMKRVGSYNQALIRANAAKRAYGFEVGAFSEESQARMDEFSGSNARTAGLISATSSILGGVSSVSSMWLKGKQTGIWGS